MTLTSRLKGYTRLTHNMSEGIQTEQITREPSVKTKVKDPKRVQAGKTLSEKNKRAREALKREEEREKEERVKDEREKEKGSDKESSGKNWILNISSQTILTIGAIGLAAYALFTNYRDRIADLHIPTPTLVFNTPPQPRVIDNNASQPVNEEEEEKNSLKSRWM